jgi:hypothetical protein
VLGLLQEQKDSIVKSGGVLIKAFFNIIFGNSVQYPNHWVKRLIKKRNCSVRKYNLHL